MPSAPLIEVDSHGLCWWWCLAATFVSELALDEKKKLLIARRCTEIQHQFHTPPHPPKQHVVKAPSANFLAARPVTTLPVVDASLLHLSRHLAALLGDHPPLDVFPISLCVRALLLSELFVWASSSSLEFQIAIALRLFCHPYPFVPLDHTDATATVPRRRTWADNDAFTLDVATREPIR